MPSIAVHLTVASLLADRLSVSALPDYYLGTISPDSVNVDGFASQQQRYAAHIRSRDPEIWLQNIAEHRRENEDKYSSRPDFYKGFLLHLYTDISWDECVQPLLFDFLRSRGIAEDKLNEKKWDELRGFDRTLSERSEYITAVEYLKAAEPLAVSTVSAELLDRWRGKIVTLQYPYPPSGFLNDSHIRAAAERAYELMGI